MCPKKGPQITNVRLLIATHIGMQFHCESQSVIYGNMPPISVINIKVIEKNRDDPDSSTLENTCCIFTIFCTKPVGYLGLYRLFWHPALMIILI